MNLDKRFFIGSFFFHLIVIVISIFMPSGSKINKTFLVYGAHSKAPMHAYFKPMRAIKNNYSKYVSSAKNGKSTTEKVVKKNSQKPKHQAKSKQKPKVKPKPKNKPARKKADAKKVSIRPVEKKIPVIRRHEVKKIVKKEKNELEKTKYVEKEKKEEKSETQEVLNFDLLGSDNPELLAYQRHIQREVCRIWRPPLGVKKGTEGRMQFSVDNSGSVKDFEFIKKSEVLIYDLSITRVARKFKFARCLWGKKFSIVFRQ